MAQIALHEAHAVKTVYKETQAMKDNTCNAETLSISTAKSCYHCGKTDNGTKIHKFIYNCKMSCLSENLAKLCSTKHKNNTVTKTHSKQAKVDMKNSKDKVHQLETVPSETELTSSIGENDHLHNILQLGDKSANFLFTTTINGVDVEMQLDSGTDQSTIPLALFQKRLAGVCKLLSTTVVLNQYDMFHLKIKGQCKVIVQELGRKCKALTIPKLLYLVQLPQTHYSAAIKIANERRALHYHTIGLVPLHSQKIT